MPYSKILVGAMSIALLSPTLAGAPEVNFSRYVSALILLQGAGKRAIDRHE